MSRAVASGDVVARYRSARTNFHAYLATGIGAALVALLLPKDPSAGLLRLACVVLFFGGLVTAFSAFVGPYAEYLKARVEFAWQDAGDEMRSIHLALASRLDQFARIPAIILIAAAGFLFLRVLAAWPIGAPLRPFAELLTLGFWLSAAAFPAQLFLSARRTAEIVQMRRAAARQAELGNWQPLDDRQLAAREAKLAGPAVVVTGPFAFEAGGIGWSWSDFQKNAVVFGQTGSGKTVTVLNALLDGLLSSAGADRATAAAALILDPKGDYRDKIDRLLRRIGRSPDLRVLDPARPEASVRWNPLDSPDDALEIAGRFGAVLALMGMKSTQDTFFVDTAKIFMRHAIGLLRAAEPAGEPPSFARIAALVSQPPLVQAEIFLYLLRAAHTALGEACDEPTLRADVQHPARIGELRDRLDATRPDQARISAYLARWISANEDWEARWEAAMLRVRDAARAGPAAFRIGSEPAVAVEYLLDTWITMPERTRGSVQSQLTTMLDPFLVEPYRTVFSGRSTVSMAEVLDQGLVFYSFMPAEDRPEMAKLVNTLLKQDYYRQVLLRIDKPRPSLFFCDEFQAFFTSDAGRGDGPFFSRSRQSFHANVVATQNFGGLLAEAPRPEIVRNFLGNCAVKLFLRNTEGETNEFASKDVFGEFEALDVNISLNPGTHGLGEQLHRRRRVPPERFARLAIPDRQSGIAFAEAMLHLGSRSEVTTGRLRFKVHPLDA